MRGAKFHFVVRGKGSFFGAEKTASFYFFGGNSMKKVAVIMGSDSDLPIVEKAFAVLDELEIPYEAHVFSAHRTPAEARDFTLRARENGFGVLIAAAGMICG